MSDYYENEVGGDWWYMPEFVVWGDDLGDFMFDGWDFSNDDFGDFDDFSVDYDLGEFDIFNSILDASVADGTINERPTVATFKQALQDGTNLTLKQKSEQANAQQIEAQRAYDAHYAINFQNLPTWKSLSARLAAANDVFYRSGGRSGSAEKTAAYNAWDGFRQEFNAQGDAVDKAKEQADFDANEATTKYNEFSAQNPDFDSLDISEQQALQLEYEFEFYKTNSSSLQDDFDAAKAAFDVAKVAYESDLFTMQDVQNLYEAQQTLTKISENLQTSFNNFAEIGIQTEAYQDIQTEISNMDFTRGGQIDPAEGGWFTDENGNAMYQLPELLVDGNDENFGRQELDEAGYDIDGYDAFGYDESGFDRDGLNTDGDTQEDIDAEEARIAQEAEDARLAEEARIAKEAADQAAADAAADQAAADAAAAGENTETINYGDLTPAEIAEGYYYNEDGILVIPETIVTGTEPEENTSGPDIDLTPIGGDDDPNNSIDDLGGGGIVTKPETGIRTAEEEAEHQARVDEIMGRFSGSRRNYNDFLRSDEGKTAAKNLGDWVNKNLSPSGEFDISQKDALLDKILSITTDGQFDGLNAFAVGVNLIEGIINTDLIDVPNIGFFINNLVDEHISDKLLSDIEKVVPDFLENITGLSAILQDYSDPASGYLAQGFDFSAWLLGDLDMARAVDYGLRPATEQIAQQQLDLATEVFGAEAANAIYNDPATTDANFFEQIVNILGDAVFGTELDQYLDDIKSVVSQEEYDEIKARVDEQPSLFSKLSELVTSGYDYLATPFSAMGNIMESIGFNQQYYLGGTLQTNLLNLVGLSSLGLPVGSLASMLGGAMAPSGQDLSDYLWANGIDPTTATRSDIGKFLVDRGYDVPGFNYETGKFEIQTDESGNELNTDTDGDGFFDSFIDNVASLVGDDTIAGEVIGSVNEGIVNEGGLIDTLIEGTEEVISGVGDTIVDITDGITGNDTTDTGDDTTDTGDNNNNNNNSTVTEVFPVVTGDDGVKDDAGNDTSNTGNENTSDGGGNNNSNENSTVSTVDGNDNIDNMPETNITDTTAYDAAYETAKFILGAEAAERFRGVGLGNSELQDIIGNYSSDISQRELQRLTELNRSEQTGINELRDIQKGSDLELLGNYGQEYADAVRGLDPTSMEVLGQQSDLSNKLYQRAAGNLTDEEQADAEERAFEIAAQSGRTLDSTRIANVIRAEEDTIANLEGRAQQAGTSTYNMSRGITGNIPAMLLGNTGNPYGTGVGLVTPPLGVGDLVNMGTSQYAQQQNIAQAQAQLASVQQNYDAAVAANQPSQAQEFLQDINEITSYISLASQGLELLGNAPQTIRNTGNSIRNAWDGITTLFGGGSSNYAYDPTSSFNIADNTFNADDYLNTTSLGTSGGFDFGNY